MKVRSYQRRYRNQRWYSAIDVMYNLARYGSANSKIGLDDLLRTQAQRPGFARLLLAAETPRLKEVKAEMRDLYTELNKIRSRFPTVQQYARCRRIEARLISLQRERDALVLQGPGKKPKSKPPSYVSPFGRS
jgi:hypothetical protein